MFLILWAELRWDHSTCERSKGREIRCRKRFKSASHVPVFNSFLIKVETPKFRRKETLIMDCDEWQFANQWTYKNSLQIRWISNYTFFTGFRSPTTKFGAIGNCTCEQFEWYFSANSLQLRFSRHYKPSQFHFYFNRNFQNFCSGGGQCKIGVVDGTWFWRSSCSCNAFTMWKWCGSSSLKFIC